MTPVLNYSYELCRVYTRVGKLSLEYVVMDVLVACSLCRSVRHQHVVERVGGNLMFSSM